jgi:hypothetical protein
MAPFTIPSSKGRESTTTTLNLLPAAFAPSIVFSTTDDLGDIYWRLGLWRGTDQPGVHENRVSIADLFNCERLDDLIR